MFVNTETYSDNEDTREIESKWSIERHVANFISAKASYNDIVISFFHMPNSNNEPLCHAYVDCPSSWRPKWLLALLINYAIEENEDVLSIVNDVE